MQRRGKRGKGRSRWRAVNINPRRPTMSGCTSRSGLCDVPYRGPSSLTAPRTFCGAQSSSRCDPLERKMITTISSERITALRIGGWQCLARLRRRLLANEPSDGLRRERSASKESEREKWRRTHSVKGEEDDLTRSRGVADSGSLQEYRTVGPVLCLPHGCPEYEIVHVAFP